MQADCDQTEQCIQKLRLGETRILSERKMITIRHSPMRCRHVMAALLGAARALARRASPIAPFWLAMAGAGALSSALNHSTQWSYSNCFMPVALFGSLAVAFATRAFAETGSAGVLAIVALGVQFCALAYNPAAQVPSRADWAALDLLDRRIDGMERPLLMPSHPFLTYQKTGQVHLHQMSIGDVAFRSGVPDLEPRIARGDWRTAVVDDATGIAALDGPMILSDRLTYRAAELYPKTGFRVRPSAVWRWSEAVERELAPRVTGNFESGSYTGWTATGGFGAAPSLRTDLPELKGIQGERAASSRNGAGPGVLESAPFVLVAPRVTMLVAGTLGAYVRALRGAEEIGRVQPADTHSRSSSPRPVARSPTAWSRRSVRRTPASSSSRPWSTACRWGAVSASARSVPNRRPPVRPCATSIAPTGQSGVAYVCAGAVGAASGLRSSSRRATLTRRRSTARPTAHPAARPTAHPMGRKATTTSRPATSIPTGSRPNPPPRTPERNRGCSCARCA